MLEVGMSGTYLDLKVWQRAMDLVYLTYEITQAFPKHELYGLTNQMRRAAVSVPSNIAEGKGRSTDKDMSLFLCHARGSLFELNTQVLIAQHLDYMRPEEAEAAGKLVAEVGRLLNGLISYAATT
ncbi:MAG: four helix bundle protein [Terriglobales bacterium]